jgi:uncharacterized zinc-type alcohol dehydrogenase-like protein
MIKAYAAHEPGGELKPFEYDPGSLGDEQVEINVEYCGICHSDLSMLDNEWGMSKYPRSLFSSQESLVESAITFTRC